MDIIEMIEPRLELLGKSKGGLAAHLGIRAGAISELLAGERKLSATERAKMAEYLELNTAPVMGRIGAGATIEPEFEQVPPDGLFQVSVPFEIPSELIAFEVDGESMLPRYDPGDILVVWKDQRRALSSFYGEEAAVRTQDGKRFLKVIQPGKGRTVDLFSFNAKPITGAKLSWIGEIYLTLRASQVRRLKRRP